MSNSSNSSNNNKNNSSINKDKKNCVKCDVCNCVHNDQNCGCTAKQILVGPDFATSQTDTTCASFKKSNC